MQTAFVAHLTLAALCAAPLMAPSLSAQDTHDVFTTAPRLRVAPTPDKPMLGVMVSDTADGVRIEEVMEGSLAERAGLQSGDLLLSLGGDRLESYTDIGDVLAGLAPGESLSMTVVREGAGLVKLEGSLPVPAAPEASKAPDMPLADGHRGGFLGVELGEADESGVYVAGVIDNSAAWFAGLEAGDILTRLDDSELDSNEDLVGAVSTKAPGTLINLAYLRDGVASETHVRLGQRMPMALPGMPGSGQVFPHAMGEGDVWFGEMPQGRQFRFFGPGHEGGIDLPEIAVPHFQGQGGHGFQLHGLEGLHEQLQKLHEDLGLDLEDGEAHELKIKIEDGKLTIEKDGEVEVRDLDEAEGISGLRLRKSAGVPRARIGIFGADGKLDVLAADADAAAAAECADALAECADAAAECADKAAECVDAKACCEAADAECVEVIEVEVSDSDDDVL